jgi:hypothetical protein
MNISKILKISEIQLKELSGIQQLLLIEEAKERKKILRNTNNIISFKIE